MSLKASHLGTIDGFSIDSCVSSKRQSDSHYLALRITELTENASGKQPINRPAKELSKALQIVDRWRNSPVKSSYASAKSFSFWGNKTKLDLLQEIDRRGKDF